MEYLVEIEVTYKYVISNTIKANSEKIALEMLNKSLEGIDLRTLENDWNWGDGPDYFGDFNVVNIEPT